MKAFVLQEVVCTKYFLGTYGHAMWKPMEIETDSPSDDIGHIAGRIEHVEWETVLETNDFNRELQAGEMIHIEGINHRIINVSHSGDGNILYYIDKKIFNEDLDSKKKARVDLEARKLILAERVKKIEWQKTVARAWNNTDIPNKKWYQFWK
jgi:hypothetical protein